jgi:hypothetical protein
MLVAIALWTYVVNSDRSFHQHQAKLLVGSKNQDVRSSGSIQGGSSMEQSNILIKDQEEIRLGHSNLGEVTQQEETWMVRARPLRLV